MNYAAGYSEAEISFELDEIAGGLLPTLLENLFNAWFPELKEVGDGNKYRLYGYTTLWYEELYNSRSEKVIIRECAKNRKAKTAKMRECAKIAKMREWRADRV